MVVVVLPLRMVCGLRQGPPSVTAMTVRRVSNGCGSELAGQLCTVWWMSTR
jgi:hypothetical protein